MLVGVGEKGREQAMQQISTFINYWISTQFHLTQVNANKTNVFVLSVV